MKRREKDRWRLRIRKRMKKKRKKREETGNWRNLKKNKTIIDFKCYIFILYSCYKYYIFIIYFVIF